MRPNAQHREDSTERTSTRDDSRGLSLRACARKERGGVDTISSSLIFRRSHRDIQPSCTMFCDVVSSRPHGRVGGQQAELLRPQRVLPQGEPQLSLEAAAVFRSSTSRSHRAVSPKGVLVVSRLHGRVLLPKRSATVPRLDLHRDFSKRSFSGRNGFFRKGNTCMRSLKAAAVILRENVSARISQLREIKAAMISRPSRVVSVDQNRRLSNRARSARFRHRHVSLTQRLSKMMRSCVACSIDVLQFRKCRSTIPSNWRHQHSADKRDVDVRKDHSGVP
jgi:hypothetical protein